MRTFLKYYWFDSFIVIAWLLFVLFTHKFIETYFNPLALVEGLLCWGIASLWEPYRYFTLRKFFVFTGYCYICFFVLFYLMRFS
jgi:hypothetical protein